MDTTFQLSSCRRGIFANCSSSSCAKAFLSWLRQSGWSSSTTDLYLRHTLVVSNFKIIAKIRTSFLRCNLYSVVHTKLQYWTENVPKRNKTLLLVIWFSYGDFWDKVWKMSRFHKTELNVYREKVEIWTSLAKRSVWPIMAGHSRSKRS